MSPTKIASLYAEIGADTTKLEAGLKNTKTGLAGANDAFKQMTGISLTAAGAITAVTGALKYCLDAAIESEKADANLQATLTSTKGAAGMTFDSIKRLTAGLSDMSSVDDEVIQNAESMLLTFTNIGKDVFPMASEAMVNMGAKFGSVDQAAIQLGKALQDPITGVSALKRVGVVLSDQQVQSVKDFMAVNDIASAQKVILGELNTEFGGLAAAMGQTMEGKVNRLKNSLENLGEIVGGYLIPILGDAADALNLLLTQDQKTSDALQEHNTHMVAVSKTYVEYTAEMQRAAEVAGYTIDKNGDLIQVYNGFAGPMTKVIQSHYLLTEAEQAETKANDAINDSRARSVTALDNYKAAHDENIAARQTGIGVMQNENIAIMNGVDAIKAQEDAARNLKTSINDLAFQMGDSMTSANKKYQDDLKKLTDTAGYITARTAQIKNMKLVAPAGDSSFFQKSKKEIDDLAAAWQKLNPSLSGKTKTEVEDLINEYYGLSGGMEATKKKIAELEAEHTKSTHVIMFNLLQQKMAQDGVIDDRDIAILKIMATQWGLIGLAEVDATLKAASWDTFMREHPLATAKEIADYINGYQDKTITMTVITKNVNGGQVTTLTSAGGAVFQHNQPTANATGGSWTIPSGFGNEGYRFPDGRTASSGERVTVTPAGKTPASGPAVVNNFNGWQGSPAQVAAEIARQQQLARLLA